MRMLVEEIFILTYGRPVPNLRRSREIVCIFLPDERRVDHQLTEEDIILCDRAEKLIYTAMKQFIPKSSDGK